MEKSAWMGLVIAALLLGACAKKGDDSSQTGQIFIPEQLQPMEISQVSTLSIQEKENLKDLFKETRVVPRAGLLVISRNETAKERAEREKDIQELGPRGKEVYKSMKKNCQSYVNETDSNLLNSRAGDRVEYRKEATLRGRKCPVIYTELRAGNLNVVSLNMEGSRSEQILEYNFSGNNRQQTQVSSSLHRETNYRGAALNSTFGTSVRVTNQGKEQYSIIKGTGVISFANQDINAEVFEESLVTGRKTQKQFKMVFKTSSQEVIVQGKKENRNERYYLNGRAVSLAEIKEIFGKAFELSLED